MKIFLGFFCLLALFGVANGQDMRSGDNVIIDKPVYENVYLAGGNITINAPIHGDLVAAGGTITVNDSIMNDLIVTGGTVIVNGNIGDDIRAACGELHINGHVLGDLVTAGGNISLAASSTIYGNVLMVGGEVNMDGNVNGALTCAVENLSVNGVMEQGIDCKSKNIKINGIVKGRSVLSANTIEAGPNAAFYHDVRYWSRNKNTGIEEALKAGVTSYDPTLKMEQSRWFFLGFTSILGMLWYLSVVFIFIVLFQYLFSRTMKFSAETIYLHTGKSLGMGLAFLLAVPVGAIVIALTVIGIPLAMLLLLSYVIILLFATIISSVLIANWIKNRKNKQWGTWRLSFVAFGAFLLLKLLFLIPVFGWVMLIVIALLAYGGILMNIKWRPTKRQIPIL